MMLRQPWMTELRHARAKPEFFIGAKPTAHLMALQQLSELVCETDSFLLPGDAAFLYSAHQCLFRWETGPLRPEIEKLMDWHDSDILFDAWIQASRALRDKARSEGVEWLRPFDSVTFGLGHFSSPLCLADRGFLAIRTHEGLWCQGYERGWPTTAPELLQSAPSIGLLLALTLNRRWFTGLPFVSKEVEAAVSEKARERIRFEYRETDDLVPDRLLTPKAIEQWL